MTIRSQLYHLPLHWIEELTVHARCPLQNCYLCADERKIKHHNAVVVQWEGGGPLELLELTESHARLANDLDNLMDIIFGQQITVTRVVRESSIDIDIALATRIVAPEIIAHNYVKSIGVKQYIRAVSMLGLSDRRAPAEDQDLGFGT